MNRPTQKVWDLLTSLKLTIVCLSALMVLVVACTLAQVRLGTLGAVNLYMRSWFYWIPLGGFSIPIFPGGAAVGLVLMLNLIAAQAKRLELSWKKAGLWIVHLGLILLFVGEFVTSAYQVDARLVFEQGQTTNFLEVPRETELAIVDQTDPAFDDVHGIQEGALARGGTVAVPNTPLSVRILAWQRNALLGPARPGLPPAGATQGVGVGLAFSPLAPVTSDEQRDLSLAVVEVRAGDRSLGTWLASNAIEQPQAFSAGGRTFSLALRDRRLYLPYSLTLEQFRHDVYPGTEIPKNFSSLVRLQNPARGEDRNVLIFMNQPLRYDGKAFYQASFGKGDTLSILQVVENPGWLIPYVSTILVTIGLLVHFAISLRRGLRRAAAAQEPAPQEAA
ncbi:MAG TPA: cytochrome c biogenesis protein ResB [Anaeromyxobacter sp.]